MNLKLSFLTFLLGHTLLLNAHAEFKCNGEIKEYAREMVQLELFGLRNPNESSCLKQERFKYIRVAHDPINELTSQKFYYAEPKTLVIDRVKSIQDNKSHYRVEFSVQAGKDANALSTKRDSLIFFENSDKLWGCAHLLFSPKNIYIAPNCL